MPINRYICLLSLNERRRQACESAEIALLDIAEFIAKLLDSSKIDVSWSSIAFMMI